MLISVNGQQHDLPPGTTVEQLIEKLGLAGAICAAEVNQAVVPHKQRGDRILLDGDVVEIVTMVGGG